MPRADVLNGVPVSENEFIGVATFEQLEHFTDDPRHLQKDSKETMFGCDERRALYAKIQRPLERGKKTNAVKFSRFLLKGLKKRNGFIPLPPITLWCEEPLELDGQGTIPLSFMSNRLVPLDGDTQLTAHYLVQRPGKLGASLKVRKPDRDRHRAMPFKVNIIHGLPLEEAQQTFATRNGEGSKPSKSLILSRDHSDPYAVIARYAAKEVVKLRGRVETQNRQLRTGKGNPCIISLSSLRDAARAFDHGIVAAGSKTELPAQSAQQMRNVRDGFLEWMAAYVQDQELQMTCHLETFASNPAVLAAVGAVGHEVFTENMSMKKARALLKSVDWERGEHWVQAGARRNPKTGNITLGAVQEAVSMVYAALMDPKSPIRP